jgi:hypothetical protein
MLWRTWSVQGIERLAQLMIFTERVTWKNGWRQVPDNPGKPGNNGKVFAFLPSIKGTLGESKHWNGTLVISVCGDKPGCHMEN